MAKLTFCELLDGEEIKTKREEKVEWREIGCSFAANICFFSGLFLCGVVPLKQKVEGGIGWLKALIMIFGGENGWDGVKRREKEEAMRMDCGGADDWYRWYDNALNLFLCKIIKIWVNFLHNLHPYIFFL